MIWDTISPVAERIFCVIALCALTPVLAMLVFLLYVLGQHPIFVQKRIGKNEIVFWIIKFRTMPDDGWPRTPESSWSWQLRGFHAFSRILRSTGLDEIPQLANVVRGDMRLVGPRPLTPEDYRQLPPDRWRRCIVAPGITGLAQVSGGQALDAGPKFELDLHFIEHGSWPMYAWILRRTLARLCGVLGADEGTWVGRIHTGASAIDRARG